MKRMIKLFKVVVLFAWAGSAYAELGNAPEKFDAESVTTISSQSGYSVRNTYLGTGTVIKEYVSNKGVVFAVTWHGPFQPDLRKLLGKHFDSMVEHAKQKARPGRSMLKMKDSEVVIRLRGHMRAYEGQAWLPALFPAGFTEGDIT